jgi:hypothetical protein
MIISQSGQELQAGPEGDVDHQPDAPTIGRRRATEPRNQTAPMTKG